MRILLIAKCGQTRLSHLRLDAKQTLLSSSDCLLISNAKSNRQIKRMKQDIETATKACQVRAQDSNEALPYYGNRCDHIAFNSKAILTDCARLRQRTHRNPRYEENRHRRFAIDTAESRL